MDLYLKNLISQGESRHLEFKFEINDSRKIARTLSAFSNMEGGILLLGVKDNGKIAGVRSDEEFYMVEAAANLYCRPRVRFSTMEIKSEGKTVLIIEVPEVKLKPVLAEERKGIWTACVRVHDENIAADPVRLKVWKNMRTGHPVQIKYGEKERILFRHFEKHNAISLHEFCSISHLPSEPAENILAGLVLLNVLTIDSKSDRTLFVINSSFDAKSLNMGKIIGKLP
ncbi:MAG: ATP-binding protein [Bacteroidota bacterium]